MKEMTKQCLLKKIQELSFATVELNLFLDNFPTHQKALMDYNMFVQELTNYKQMYEMKYGPLSNFGCSPSQYPWGWVEEPWPWERGL